MDLKKIVVLTNEGVWLPIFSADNTTVLFEVKMTGRDGDDCTLAVSKNVEKSRNRKGKANLKQSDEDNKATVIACIKSWRDPDMAVIDEKTGKPDLDNLKEVIYRDGKELVCNFLNKKALLDEYGFIYRQADAYIMEDSSFFKIAEQP